MISNTPPISKAEVISHDEAYLYHNLSDDGLHDFKFDALYNDNKQHTNVDVGNNDLDVLYQYDYCTAGD